MLHSFYTGVENIFKRIAVEIDNNLPGGAFWHSELLDLMMQPGASRPPVISVDLRARLKEYLAELRRGIGASGLGHGKISS